MKQSKDPFEAAFEESPPESPIETEPDPDASIENPNSTYSSLPQSTLTHEEDNTQIKTPNSNNTITNKSNNNNNKDDEDDEEEDNMDVELAKFPTAGDPHKMAKMQLVLTFFFSLCYFIINPNFIFLLIVRAILSQFTEEQMSRYESFRRAGFQKANMKRVIFNFNFTFNKVFNFNLAIYYWYNNHYVALTLPIEGVFGIQTFVDCWWWYTLT